MAGNNIGFTTSNKVGQASTRHLSYYIDKKVRLKGKKKNLDAQICIGCTHNDSGYCKLHESWCYMQDRSKCAVNLRGG
jgi:hypothetical protein